MKTGLAKRLPLLFIGIVLLVTTSTAMAADPTNTPYLKLFGADVMTGGWFENNNTCSSDPGTSNYQNPKYKTSGFAGDDRIGGILTYTKSAGNASGGSSSQYGAFSLGEIDGRRQPSTPDGFYSDGAQAGSPVKTLSFANTDGSNFGGKFEGDITQNHCIPDYYSKKPSTTKSINNISEAIGQGTGSYSATAPAGGSFDLTNGNGDHTVKSGDRITIYIKGNVYIDGNIVYDSSSTVSSVPKFALIVKGSIYIDNTVSHLDGMYVAEPADTSAGAVSADDGVIWTCHNSSTSPIDYTYPSTCKSPLVVNGALIAKQIKLLRVNGDINSPSANTGEDSLNTVTNCFNGACNVAEVVNYTPAMVMGGGFFDKSTSSSSNTLPIDNVISLPPIF